MKRGKTDPTTLGAVLADGSLPRQPRRVDRGTWANVVGDRVATRTEPLGLERGVLAVRVSSSVWAQELSLLAPTIVGRLRANGWMVSRLRFVVGKISPPAGPVAREVRPRVERPLPAELSRRLEALADPELRQAITEAASRLIGDDSDDGRVNE